MPPAYPRPPHAPTASVPQARRPGALRSGAAVLFALALVLVVAPSTARTAAAAPEITGMRVSTVSATSFTVQLTSLGTGWEYHLFASTDKADVYYDNLPRAPYRSATSRQPNVTVTGLAPTLGQYWYRVQATKGASHHTSAIASVGLLPAAPTGLRASTATRGALSLTWQGSAAGYDVQWATDAAFTAGTRTVTVTGGSRQLTPDGLATGERYWFRVRSDNGGTRSAWTGAASATSTADGQDLRVMTYNLLTLDDDGTTPSGGEKIAPWSARRPAAARYITGAAPDVVAVQEGSAWVGAARGARQVDSLRAELGSAWSLARTEVAPDQPHYFRTGVYLLFDASRYEALGTGGHWDLGTMPGGGSRWAAYQVLRNRSSGATVLVVSTHLYAIGGTAGDELRRQEMASLIRQATAYAEAQGGLPVVYAGDVNSHERHALDGPHVAAQATGTADTSLVAPSRTNAQYNTANQYHRTPPASGLALDRIYAAPGVAVVAWRQVLQLSGGRFAGVIPSDHNPVVADLVVPR